MRHERPITVPYVTARRDEYQERAHKLRFIDGRLCWADEDPRDRDHQGVLWARTSHMPPNPETGHPTGTPVFARVHAHRQHEVMSEMWCQVCRRNKASRTESGWLFLLPASEEGSPDRPEGEAVIHPPLCLPDARQTLERCPKLREGHIAVRARRPKLHGVLGYVYQPTRNGGAELFDSDDPRVVVPYRGDDGRRHRLLAYTLASQLVRVLHDCTRVDMAAEPTQ